MINMEMENKEVKDRSYLQKLVRRIALISGVFTTIVAAILILNYVQLKTTDPLELKSLETLKVQLSEDTQNEVLKDEIRALDVLARKAYFTSQWQIRTGGILLLLGAVITIIALRYAHNLKFSIKSPDAEDASSGQLLNITSRQYLYAFGLFVVFLAGLTTFLSDKSFHQLIMSGEYLADTTDAEIVVVETKVPEEADEPQMEDTLSADVTEAEVVDDTGEDVQEPAEEEETEPVVVETSKERFTAFRGNNSLGIASAKNIPVNWNGSSGQNIKWKLKIPKKGYSSPIIWNDNLFLTGADGSSREVYAINRLTGALLWTASADNIPGSPATAPKTTDDTGLAAPTMTTDGTRLFAIFGTGDLLCLDMNGKRLWARNLGVPKNHYGHSSSLLCHNGALLVQYDDSNGGKIMALDVQTGKDKWVTTRKAKISWASPILARVNNTTQVIINSDPFVAGYDAVTGKELWTVDCLYGEVGASPAYADGVVYTAAEYANLTAIKLGPTPEILWQNNEYLPEVASPLVTGKILIIATSYGVVACFDKNNGELLWEKDFGNGFYASPMLAEGKIFISDMEGVTHIVKASEQLEVIAEPKLGEKVVSTPVFATGNVYIRGFENLYCIGAN